MKRAIIIVLDGVGVGEMPDAHLYSDEGSDTLGSIIRGTPGFRLPNLEKLGLANIDGLEYFDRGEEVIGCYGKMAEKSPGKDTTTGHWELGGIILDRPFPVYPSGFPREIMDMFTEKTSMETLGNIQASGTIIIEQLGKDHLKTGYPIVYTSADSVFQIAAHEEVIPVERLYELCLAAREILTGEHAVGRVIARPFTGEIGSFRRTAKRRDFSLVPFEDTILDYIQKAGMPVIGVGKISDIFAKKGIDASYPTTGNPHGIMTTIRLINEETSGLIFTNLVDFDMHFGHRNDVKGFADALMEFDRELPHIISSLKRNDILFITADHGCDPGTPSTDHSREYVPLLVYGKSIKKGVNLGIRNTFADVPATIAQYLEIDYRGAGTGFYDKIK